MRRSAVKGNRTYFLVCLLYLVNYIVYRYIISNNGMTVSDEFSQLLFVKVMQHGTTT